MSYLSPTTKGEFLSIIAAVVCTSRQWEARGGAFHGRTDFTDPQVTPLNPLMYRSWTSKIIVRFRKVELLRYAQQTEALISLFLATQVDVIKPLAA